MRPFNVSAYVFVIIVVLASKSLVVGAGLAALAGDGSDFFFGAVGEITGVGAVRRHN
jgi:hypothetical protein